jgi:hypothetical protein
MGVPIEDGIEIRRTYAGAVQRSQGAWSWMVAPRGLYGSHYPVSSLLAAPRLVVVWSDYTQDWTVDPYDGPPAAGITTLVEPDPTQPVETEAR